MNEQNERSIFDACPTPWRLEKKMLKATKTCHHPHPAYLIFASNGNRVMMTEKLMTKFVELANSGALK